MANSGAGEWGKASSGRAALLAYLQEAIGCGTMLDSRRTLDYDSGHLVDRYLNQAEVKVGPPGLHFSHKRSPAAASGRGESADQQLPDQLPDQQLPDQRLRPFYDGGPPRCVCVCVGEGGVWGGTAPNLAKAKRGREY